jgi:cytochrome b
MAFTHEGIKAGGATPSATVKVWDPFLRVFHWTLLTLFVIAFVTGDESERVHIAAGYGIAILLALRLAWDVVGPRNARFSACVRSPHVVLAYLLDVANLRTRRYLGHNPAGGAMIVGLMAALIGTAVTGYIMTIDAYWGVKWVEEVHEALASRPQACCIVRIWSKRCGRDASGQCKRALEAAQRNRRLQLRRCRVSPRRVFQATTADVLPMRRL